MSEWSQKKRFWKSPYIPFTIEGWFSVLPRSLIIENHGDLVHPESCHGCSFAPDCNLAQTGDSRCSMCHTSHVTCLMAKKKKKHTLQSGAVQTSANMQICCSHTFSPFFTCRLQTEGGKSEAFSTDSLTIQLLAASQFDSIQHCSLQKRLGMKMDTIVILILVHLAFCLLDLIMPRTITLTSVSHINIACLRQIVRKY